MTGTSDDKLDAIIEQLSWLQEYTKVHEEVHRNLLEKILEHRRILFGDGLDRPGLVARLARQPSTAQQWFLDVSKTVVANGVLALVGGLLYVYLVFGGSR